MKKSDWRSRVYIISLLTFLMVNSLNAQSSEAPLGKGTAEEPYLIATLENLFWITESIDRLDDHYLQVNDIDALEVKDWTWAPSGSINQVGRGWNPIGFDVSKLPNYLSNAFNGVYDGNGKTISNINSIWQDSKVGTGLFSKIGESGIVKNLTISNLDINGGFATGGLCGDNFGEILNVKVSGKITGNPLGKDINGFINVGGLVGRNFSGLIKNSNASIEVSGGGLSIGGLVGVNRPLGTIENSYSRGTVTSFINQNSNRIGGLVGSNSGVIKTSFSTVTVENVSSINEVGGFVGRNAGHIFNSFSTGKVSGGNYIGGFVGFFEFEVASNLEPQIGYSYALGSVTGLNDIGGFLGGGTGNKGQIRFNYSIGSVSGSGANIGGFAGSAAIGAAGRNYWNSTISNQSTSAFGQPLTETQMRNSSNFLDWDFSATWNQLSNSFSSYPFSRSIRYGANEGITELPVYPGLQTFSDPMILRFNLNFSPGNTISMPLNGQVDVLVDWGDGNLEQFTSAGIHQHTYTNSGVYEVKVYGSLEGFGNRLDGYVGSMNLIEVKAFGDLGLKSLQGAFLDAINLTKVPTSIPSSVTNVRSLFEGAKRFNQDISNWNTGNITNMSRMFWQASAFNQPIGSWDVSKVTTMGSMFSGASSFNADLGMWDVSNVEDFFSMFSSATSFEGTGLEKWNTASLKQIAGMFNFALKFDADLGNWDVSRAQNFKRVFWNASDFKGKGLSEWDVSNATDMEEMLSGALKFDADLSSWNVEKVTSMRSTFYGTLSFKGEGLSLWKPLSVTNFSSFLTLTGMSSADYDQLLIAWSKLQLKHNVVFDAKYIYYLSDEAEDSKSVLINSFNWTITDAGRLQVDQVFYFRIDTRLSEGKTLSLPLFGNVDVTVDWGDGTVDMITNAGLHEHTLLADGIYEVKIFGELEQFGNGTIGYTGAEFITDVLSFGELGLQSLKGAFKGAAHLKQVPNSLPSTVANLRSMFEGASIFNQAISGWDTGNITDMSSMFNNAGDFNQPIGNWDVRNVTTMSSMFARASSFNADLGLWDVSKVQSFDFMFFNATAFEGTGLENWQTLSATNTRSMFTGGDLFKADLGSWDVSRVTSMLDMFYGARLFDADLTLWEVGLVEDMSGMFYEASSFKGGGLDKWNVSNVNDMSYMFYGASLFDSDLALWEVNNVNDMTEMFYNASSFKGIGIDNWNVSNVTTMSQMFNGASLFDADLTLWDVGQVKNMAAMFQGASAFKGKGLDKWNITSVIRPEPGTGLDGMLFESGLTSENYDALLIAWSKLNLQPNLRINAKPTQYSSGEASIGRQAIIDDFSWTIIDGGMNSLYARGSGTEADPFQIETWEHLYNIRENLDAYFVLNNDLDETIEGYAEFVGGTMGWLPVGTSSEPFRGIFNGNRKQIRKLRSIHLAMDDVAMFSYLRDAKVFDLGLVDVDIHGSAFVGSLAARVQGNTQIQRIFSSGRVRAQFAFAGGFVASCEGSFSIPSPSLSDIYSLVSVEGGLGGTPGSSWSAFGGIAAMAPFSVIQRVYAAGTVIGQEDVGGVLGLTNNHRISNSYWDVETSGVGAQGNTNGGAIGKTPAEMKDITIFTDAGWDFENVWQIKESSSGYISYPYLRGLDYDEPEVEPAVNPVPGLRKIPYSGGLGSVEVPFQIATAADLIALSNSQEDWNKHFIQTSDIVFDVDRKLVDWNGDGVIEPEGADLSGFLPIGLFSGTYNGNGFKIYNLQINRPDEDEIGLFGKIGLGAQVYKLGLEDASVLGRFHVGVLSGLNEGTVREVYTHGDVIASNIVGGMVGENLELIENSYSGAIVTGNTVAGFVGLNSGMISKSYSTGLVTPFGGKLSVFGGFVAINDNGMVTDSFWDTETSQRSGSSGGEGKTTLELKFLSTFTNVDWDFDNVWQIEEGIGASYPYLRDAVQGSVPGYIQYFAGGDGSFENPFQIETWEHLYNIRFRTVDHFILKNDLAPQTLGYDLFVENENGLVDGGKGWMPIDTFHGTIRGDFGGQLNSIKGLKISRSSSNTIGLFAEIKESASVQDLLLYNASVNGSNGVGILAGNSSGVILRVGVSGSVTGNSSVGGLVGTLVIEAGQQESPYIESSFANVQVNAIADGAGGLVGYIAASNNAMILNSYAKSSVIGSDNVGGLVGLADNSGIYRSYAAGLIETNSTGAENVGGLIGKLLDLNAADIKASLYDTETTGQAFDPTIDAGVGKNSIEMKSLSTYTALNETTWDFENVWQIKESTSGYFSYPYLRAFEYDEPELEPELNPIPGLFKIVPQFKNIATAVVREGSSPSNMVLDIDAIEKVGAEPDVNITYTISGVEAAAFNIDLQTGLLTFISSPVWIDNSDNVYELTVTASHVSGNTSVQDLKIFVYPEVALGDNVSSYQLGNVLLGRQAGDEFGHSISLSANGRIMAIGSENSDGNGAGSGAGQVRVFEFHSQSWVQLGQDINGVAINNKLGNAISINSDGTVLAVAALQNSQVGTFSGQVRVFKYDSNSQTWLQLGSAINGDAAGNTLGRDVSINADGSVLAISARGGSGYEGFVRIYKYSNDDWLQVGSTLSGNPGESAGRKISLNLDGSMIALSKPYFGKDGLTRLGLVQVYKNINNNWVQVGQDLIGENQNDDFGRAISLSANGSTLAVGTPFSDPNGISSGQVKIFRLNAEDQAWVQIGSNIDGDLEADYSGEAIELSADGSVIAIGARGDRIQSADGTKNGRVRVYREFENDWILLGDDFYGVTEGDQAGKALSLSADGTTLAIGSIKNDDNGTDAGHVRVFKFDNLPEVIGLEITGEPTEGAVLTASYDYEDIDGDVELGTTFRWFRANDNNGNGEVAITGTTSANYTLTNDDLGKFIRVEVMPKNNKNSGSAENSGFFGPIKNNQIITFNPITNKIYGDAPFALNASINSDLEITFESSDSNVLSISGNTATIHSVGQVTITASQTGNDQYIAAQNVIQNVIINPASLTITAEDKTKIYGSDNPTLTLTYSGLVNGDTKVATEPSVTTTATVGSGVGTYPITLTGGSDPNYDISLVDGVLEVTKASLTITADDKDKVYGSENPALTFTYTGLVNGDTKVATESSISTTATANSGVGSYPITLTGGSDPNYDISLADGVLEVTKASLTITADDMDKVYGSE
ncbi:BspA family leucine-rich repeat surface protein, partial [Belliella aquatica]